MVKYTDREKEIAIEFAHDLVDCGIYDYIDNTHHYFTNGVEAQAFYIKRDRKRQIFYDNLKALPYDTTIASGATRGVFMRDDGELDGWVIKVDFTDNTYNYCKTEAELYSKAIDECVDYAFAATYYLTTINDIDFYIQERLNCDSEYEAVSSEKLREYVIEEYDLVQEENENDDDYEWRVSDYQENRIEWEEVLSCLIEDGDVENFVYAHGINDLHQANYGILPNGVIKIVDYCGYRE